MNHESWDVKVGISFVELPCLLVAQTDIFPAAFKFRTFDYGAASAGYSSTLEGVDKNIFALNDTESVGKIGVNVAIDYFKRDI